jgi:hypothetical protein
MLDMLCVDSIEVQKEVSDFCHPEFWLPEINW